MAPKSKSLKQVALPYNEESKESELTCFKCGKFIPNWLKLEKHIVDNHAIKKKQISDSFLHGKALAQRMQWCTEMTALEQECVTVVSGDYLRCKCKICHQEMNKRSAEGHFVGKHKMPSELVKKWLVVTDGHAIKNEQWFKCSKLEEAYSKVGQPSGGDVGECDADEVPELMPSNDEAADDPGRTDDSQAFASQPSQASSSLVAHQPGVGDDALSSISLQLQSIHKKLDAAQEVEIELPRMALTSLAKKWTHSQLKTGPSGNRTCPINECHDHDDELEAFKAFLVAKDKDEDTVDGVMLHCRRLFALCKSEGGNFSLPGMLIAMYQQKLFDELFRCDVVHPDYTWTRKISDALTAMCNYCALQLGMERYWNAKNVVLQMGKESLSDLKQRTSVQKKKAGRAKGRADAALIANFASPDKIKVAVKQAMVDLYNIKVNHAVEAMSTATKSAATIAMVGIIYLNGFAGRSGEWQRMLRSHVQSQIQIGANHLVCSDHKTAKQYGDLAKGVSPGTFRAMQVYMSLPGMTSPLLLQPTTLKAKHCSVHKCLPKFGERYLPGSPSPKCNLIRKMFHVKVDDMHNKGEHLGILSKVDAHSIKVIKDVYIVRTFEEDAKLGLMLCEQVLGAPVEWPTEDELAIDDGHWTIVSQQAVDDAGDDDAGSDDEDMKDLGPEKLQELVASIINWKQSSHATTAPLLAPPDTEGDGTNAAGASQSEVASIPASSAEQPKMKEKDEKKGDKAKKEKKEKKGDTVKKEKKGDKDKKEEKTQKDKKAKESGAHLEVAAEPVKKRKGRPSVLEDGEEEFIAERAREWARGIPGNIPPAIHQRKILDDGIQLGKLRKDVKLDSVRWICEKTCRK